MVVICLSLSCNSYQAGFFAIARNRAGEWVCICAAAGGGWGGLGHMRSCVICAVGIVSSGYT